MLADADLFAAESERENERHRKIAQKLAYEKEIDLCEAKLLYHAGRLNVAVSGVACA